MNRMRLWRSKKKFGEAGRQVQVSVWTPEQDAELTRELCSRVAEPTERGRSLRSVLRQQLNRRRTIYGRWSGGSDWKAELDGPLIGRWWFLRHIGGRILGPYGTHIELSPDDSETLSLRLEQVCKKELENWVKERKLTGVRRDDTGVVITPHQYRVSGDENTASSGRPIDDEAFAANEAQIARTALQEAVDRRKPPFQDPSIIEYEGAHGFPSYCQVAHRRHGERVQFALIHMTYGGTSVTNMVEDLATLMRQQFYPKVDPGLIDWFDVEPPHTYYLRPDLIIHPVRMRHLNGIYSDPEWDSQEVSPDWAAFVEKVIARGQKARETAQAIPQEGPEKPVAI